MSEVKHWNYTGTIIGRLSMEEIQQILVSCTLNSDLRQKIVRFLLEAQKVELEQEEKLGLEISLPLTDEERKELTRVCK